MTMNEERKRVQQYLHDDVSEVSYDRPSVAASNDTQTFIYFSTSKYAPVAVFTLVSSCLLVLYYKGLPLLFAERLQDTRH